MGEEISCREQPGNCVFCMGEGKLATKRLVAVSLPPSFYLVLDTVGDSGWASGTAWPAVVARALGKVSVKVRYVCMWFGGGRGVNVCMFVCVGVCMCVNVCVCVTVSLCACV